MSETPINYGTSEDRVQFPVWRTLINLVIAVLSATLAPFIVCLLTVPLWLILGELSYYAPAGILKGLAEAAGITSLRELSWPWVRWVRSRGFFSGLSGGYCRGAACQQSVPEMYRDNGPALVDPMFFEHVSG